jgi:polyprenyl-phospho-N-acetylgalactosaminyl synthase
MRPTPVSDPATATVTSPKGVWVVVAAYNEATRLSRTLQTLCRHYAQVVVVDDGSTDGTSEVAGGYPVWLVRHPINCGQGAALQTGIDFALQQQAAFLVTFDADGQHDVADIARVLEPVCRGDVDICLGSRFLGHALRLPWSRWLVLKIGVLVTRVCSWIHVTDTHNGLRALSRHAAQQIRITQNRMAHASEILDQVRQLRLRYCEAPVTIRYDDETLAKGQSSWNSLRILGQFLLGRMIR